MNQVTPTILAALIGSGILLSIAQLITAWANRISLKNNASVLNQKLDTNTALTEDIHKATNGPLTKMGQDVINIATQAAINAAIARTDLKSKEPNANTPAPPVT